MKVQPVKPKDSPPQGPLVPHPPRAPPFRLLGPTLAPAHGMFPRPPAVPPPNASTFRPNSVANRFQPRPRTGPRHHDPISFPTLTPDGRSIFTPRQFLQGSQPRPDSAAASSSSGPPDPAEAPSGSRDRPVPQFGHWRNFLLETEEQTGRAICKHIFLSEALGNCYP
jgi:hypothetical protein